MLTHLFYGFKKQYGESMCVLKKLALVALAISSSTVFAGSMGPVCTPGNVTIPCEQSGWSFGASALYLQPSYSFSGFSDTEHLTIFQNPLFIANGGATINKFNNQWAWGFKLEGSYYFNSGNDLSLNWYHLNHSVTQIFSGGVASLAPNNSGTINSFIDGLSGAQFFSNVSSYLNTQWDAVNLEVGQHMNFSLLKNVRFYGGFQYARINTVNNDTAISPSNAVVLFQNLDNISTANVLNYNGFGPRVGTDLFYSWNNGFSVYASGAAALLVGSRGVSGTIHSVANILAKIPPGTSFTAVNSGSSTVIVPELEAKLGANYIFALAQGNVQIDAGWMWANYFNAQGTTIDFGVQGPYAGLKWIGTIA